MVIAKTASRNVAFKAAKMSEALLEAQSSFISRNVVDNETSSDHESLEVLGRIADLHMPMFNFIKLDWRRPFIFLLRL